VTTTNCRMLPEVLVMGVPSVDAQHESLFCGIENLKFRCLEANELQLALFNALLDDLREHFHTEELIARTAGIDFVEHAEMHSQTLITLNAWGEQVSSGQRDVFSFLRYLEIWFERHIREEDLPFAKQLIVAQVNVGGL
jgi:hemerythrin